MPEELSPELKLYVKEEIENVRTKIKEDVEKVKSKATRTFSTVAMVVGLLTGLGVYYPAQSYIDIAITKGLESTGFTELKSNAENLVITAEDLVADANNILSQLKKYEQDPSPEGYAWVGDIKFVWGTEKSTTHKERQTFKFGEKKFPNECFAVIPGLAGYVVSWNKEGFVFKKLSQISWPQDFAYVAIGH